MQCGYPTACCTSSFAAYLPIEHGDIKEYLTIRDISSPIQRMSFAVTVTDKWMQEMIDGCWVDWTFSVDFDEEEQEEIQALWDEEYFEGLEGDGWFVEETEQWIHGPITLKNMDTGEEWHGDESGE